MMQRLTTFLVGLLAFGTAAYGQQAIQDTDWTQGFMLKGAPLSFGGAFRALADTNAAILYNPAGLAQKKGTIAASADYVRNGRTSSQVISGAVADSQATDFMVFGLSYDRDNPVLAGTRTTVQQVTLAGAGQLASTFYFGTSVKTYFTRVASPLVSAPTGADMDLGLLVKPIPMVSLGITGQNLIRGKTYREFPMMLGFGGALTLEPHARVAVDLTKNLNTAAGNGVNAYFGGELRAMEGIYLRGGFGLDRILNDNFYSIGATLQGPKISLLFTFTERLNPRDEIYATNIELYF